MIEKFEAVAIFRRKTLGLAFTMGAAALAFAQEKSTVTGRIVNNQNQPVPYAAVTFESANKTNNDAALADDKGNFTVQLVPGNYSVTVEAFDHKKVKIQKQISRGNIGTIKIERESIGTNAKTTEIESVTITATAKPMRVEIDKKVYDPSQDVISKGGNLQDVLQNVPSVNVETDGTVSMRGNSNVKFLINGKPSSLLGIDDGADALKSISAEQIERIEVITNPSSKFEAGGTSGILNIILKKNKRTGFNGSVTGSLGYLPQTSLNANLGWKKGNLSWFLNGGGGYREGEFTTENDLIYKVPTSLKARYERGTSESNMDFYNISSGIVYDFNERTSVNLSGSARTFLADNSGTVDRTYQWLNAPETADRRNTVGRTESYAFQADIGADHKFNNNGHNISVSLSAQKRKSESPSTAGEFQGAQSLFEDFVKQINETKNLIGKVDYELPIGEKSKLEAGYRIDINDFNYDNDISRSEMGSPVFQLPRFTNKTDYTETFNAAYLQFKSKIGEKFGYQLGLRNEHSSVDIDYRNLANENIIKKKNYNSLFPSIYLSYELSKGNEFLLNFSRRIDRPRGFFMIPNGRYSNPLNIFEGNIDLDPSFVNSFELGYNFSKRKITLNPTLYYKKTLDDVKVLSYRKDLRDTSDNDPQTLYAKPINLGDEERYGLDLNFSLDPLSWLRLMGSVDLYGYRTTGIANYEYIDANGMVQNAVRNFEGDGFNTRARLNTTFRFDKTLSLQLMGFYRGGRKTATSKSDPMYGMDLGISKTIWKGDGNINFSVQDVFNSRNRTNYSFTEEFDSRNYMKYSPRNFSISLTYRFREGEKVDTRRRPRQEASFQDDEMGM
ncbi:TonB-dependent receptor domain-containing protein [Cruoricaptor ignavus]|uniref:TonB-dependent receptor domain-containing protein n=1 Tax=Cruoricaptor ignavus TaxID=1118202 RepID=UPI00370D1790